jgi:hypothetical protein
MPGFCLDRPSSPVTLVAHEMTEDDARTVLVALAAGRTARHCGQPLSDDRSEGAGWTCARFEAGCGAWVQTHTTGADLHTARRLTT